jgi:hypothetical protein
VSASMQNAVKYCAARSRNCGQSAVPNLRGLLGHLHRNSVLGLRPGKASPEAAQRKAEKMCRERANDCTLAVMWRRAAAPGSRATLPPRCTGPDADSGARPHLLVLVSDR